ncbi:MAG TPA: aldose 1-epimerase, partial [Acidimicrobiia bacterium]|nr:aldose 1-epimerase [Acidimicrobiia bacterium]
MSPGFEECLFQGEPGIKLIAGETEATFLPAVGMTGVSLRHRGNEYLDMPGGVEGLRERSTAGLPLLAPWANRLSSWEYTVGDTHVDLSGSKVPTRDNHDLPIHGLLLASTDWQIDRQRTSRGKARLDASIHVDMPEFPFHH